MTQIYKQLNEDAAIQIIYKVMKQAFNHFPEELEGCKIDDYLYGSSVSIRKIWIKTDTIEVGILHKSIQTETRTGWDYTAIRAEILRTTNVDGIKASTLELISHASTEDNRDYDNVTLWVAGQLEKIFDKIVVNLNDPSKIGTAIGWRCAYCNHTNTAKSCEHCGAPKAW